MSSNQGVLLRPAKRSDIPALVHNANAGFAQSALHRRIALHQDRYPTDYHAWRLNIIRQRFATPNLRTIVAVDARTDEILGQASWAIEGSETALYKRWTSDSTWLDWLEGQLISAEKTWTRYVTDRSVDYKFLDGFMAAFLGSERHERPDCLHLHMIAVDPATQSRGVGRLLVDWGKDLAAREGLPLYLEAVVEATGFYEKAGFSRLNQDCAINADGQETYRVPVFAWESEQGERRWLEQDMEPDATRKRWRWRSDVLSD